MQLWVVWYHRLIGETEGPALITDTACTATYRRFPSWHTDKYSDAGGTAPATPAPPLTADALSSSRDRVRLSLAGVRIELTGAHAERIVRFVLGQLGGARC